MCKQNKMQNKLPIINQLCCLSTASLARRATPSLLMELSGFRIPNGSSSAAK